jgi:putative CocE/NonD family hydrolase
VKLVLASAAAAVAGAAGAEVAERGVPVRMRDGVVLRADVFRPAGTGPFPVLVYRTPYDRKDAPSSHITFKHAVERGYAVVVQDVRGRYGSEGEFVPYANEGRDGYDTIEWAAVQPWSNGKVGTFGLSYPGAVQWLAAVEGPPHLEAMAPAMTFSTARNFVYSGGLFDMSWTSWLWHNIAPDVRVKKGLAGPTTEKEARASWSRVGQALQGRLPITDQPELRPVAPWLFDWMSRPPGDPSWEWMEIRGKYGRTKAAVLNFSGWYDEAYGPEGAVTNFLGVRAARSAPPDPRARLVVGPWVHGVPSRKERSSQAGDRVFGEAALLDYDALVLGFLDRYVRGVTSDAAREPPVRVFVMGENAWQDADAWPLPGTRERTLFLAGPAGPGKPGRLRDQATDADAASSGFASDPARPVTDPFADRAGAHDYRDLPKRSDVLVFETEPLAEPLRVVGAARAELYLSADAPDADLWVLMFDVLPDGTAWNLMSPGLDVLRASYRESGPERVLLRPGEAVPLRFETLFTGNLFDKGHCLRVVLAGSFFPHFSRNLQTGELETKSGLSRPATLTIHHDRAHPSRLVLPSVAR